MKLTGITAWFTWLLVHILFLIGFRSRVSVVWEWFWSYVTFQRGARLITGISRSIIPPATAVPPDTSMASAEASGTPAEERVHKVV